MPITDRSKAKPSGFAQVRAAMRKFEGDVVAAEFGQWGGKLVDEDTGRPLPPKEFLEVSCTNVQVLEVSEELAMPIDEWNFRVNCSDFEGSFWVDHFLESADRAKLQIPDELVGKRVIFEKATLKFTNKKGEEVVSENFVIAGVKIGVQPPAPVVVQPVISGIIPQVVAEVVAPVAPEPPAQVSADPMEIAALIASGKTEVQFRAAIATNPVFINSPLLAMAKAGVITQTLVNEGRLVVVGGGVKAVYQRPV